MTTETELNNELLNSSSDATNDITQKAERAHHSVHLRAQHFRSMGVINLTAWAPSQKCKIISNDTSASIQVVPKLGPLVFKHLHLDTLLVLHQEAYDQEMIYNVISTMSYLSLITLTLESD